MKPKRILLTILCLWAFSMLWNGLVHLVVLREAEQALATVARPASERNVPLALLLTALLASLFTWSLPAGVRVGRATTQGLTHGLFFAALAGLLVDANQYLLYPIPGTLALAWFACGTVEFCAWGIIAATLSSAPAPERHEG